MTKFYCQSCGVLIDPKNPVCQSCGSDNAQAAAEFLEKQKKAPRSKHYQYGKAADPGEVELLKRQEWENMDLDSETILALRTDETIKEEQKERRFSWYKAVIVLLVGIGITLAFGFSDLLFLESKVDYIQRGESAYYASNEDGIFYYFENAENSQLWKLNTSGDWNLLIDFSVLPNAQMPYGPFYKTDIVSIRFRAQNYRGLPESAFDIYSSPTFLAYNPDIKVD